ncbi:MAG: HAMP domain-containing histidine kinase [Anaerolineales bacterium]|nr:HAMP domain-containing histidine kinase [Anaerolineales bacterium]
MQTTLRTRLTYTTLGVLVLGMGLAAAFSWMTVERLYLDTQRENLLAQAQLYAADLQGIPIPPAEDPYSQVSNVMPGIHSRVFEEENGAVVGLPLPEGAQRIKVPPAEQSSFVSRTDLVRRPEIDSALKGTPAAAVRRVASANNRRVLYAAAPIFSETGTISGIVYLATPLPAGGLPREIILQLLGAILAAILLATLAGNLLARRITRPLQEIARAARLVSDGDLEQQVPAQSKIRELRSLGGSFNRMTASLRQAAQAKTAFIADVTHELRTPLTVIKGTIETLEDGAINDTKDRGPLLTAMQRETDRLIRLVNQLLVLTRADAGALQLDLKTIDMATLAQNRCQQITPLANKKRITLSVQAENTVEALGDPDRIAQILDNLLDNAIRHSPQDAAVILRIKNDGQELCCTVSDRGPGIPEEHLPMIFGRFYRAETSRDRQSGGTGLGLAIVQSLVKAMRGRVKAESPPGEGTTISFWLPARKD